MRGRRNKSKYIEGEVCLGVFQEILTEWVWFYVVWVASELDLVCGISSPATKSCFCPIRISSPICLFLPYQRRKHSSSMEADDRESPQGPQWLTCRLLEFPLFLQYGQTPQTELLVALHLWTPTHPHSEWETHTM